jgi:Fe-S-cluster containining protein
MMKNFVDTKEGRYHFSSCNECQANCCSGAHGSICAQILLEDFELVYKYFPILFTKGDLGYIKPVILLTNGKDHCKYIKDYRCTIYENRPSICRAYPLSPNLDNNIYIDLNCPAIGECGSLIVDDGKVTHAFDNPILHDYQQKYIQTHLHIDKYNKDENLKYLFTIAEVEYFALNSSFGDSYLQLHIESLKNIDIE